MEYWENFASNDPNSYWSKKYLQTPEPFFEPKKKLWNFRVEPQKLKK